MTNRIDELVHRVNNLLGTIQLQCDVARATGTLDAHRQALRLIEESAQRTHAELQRIRGEHGSRGLQQ